MAASGFARLGALLKQAAMVTHPGRRLATASLQSPSAGSLPPPTSMGLLKEP